MSGPVKDPGGSEGTLSKVCQIQGVSRGPGPHTANSPNFVLRM